MDDNVNKLIENVKVFFNSVGYIGDDRMSEKFNLGRVFNQHFAFTMERLDWSNIEFNKAELLVLEAINRNELFTSSTVINYYDTLSQTEKDDVFGTMKIMRKEMEQKIAEAILSLAVRGYVLEVKLEVK